jgi:hypothetical protein
VIGEHGRVDPARELPQLLDGCRNVCARGVEELDSPGSRVEARGHQLQRDRERDQTLLGAVVEVALEPAPFGVTRLDDARTRGAELFEPGTKVRLQTLVLERDPGRGGDRADQLRLVAERTVVDERRHTDPVSLHERREPPVAVRGERNRPAVDVHVRVVLRNPVGECERGIVKRPGERVPQGARRTCLAQLDEEVAHGGSCQPGAQEPGEKGNRHGREENEGDTVEEQRPPAHHVDREDDGVDEQRGHADEDGRHYTAKRRAGVQPPANQDGDDHGDGGQQDRPLGRVDRVCDPGVRPYEKGVARLP